MAEQSQSEVTNNLIKAVLFSGFGPAFQHGYNTGVLANVERIAKAWIKNCGHEDCPDDTEIVFIWAWIVSVFCLGGLVGGMSVGVMASSLGRKWSILASNIFVILGALFMGIIKASGSYVLLIVGRFFIGVASGMAAGFTPMYLTEIAPTELKGAIGTVYQLVLTISISIAQILGLSSLMGTPDLWPILLAVTAAPGLCQLLTFTFCPDSPSFLFSIDDINGATESLKWLRQKDDVAAEIEEFQIQKKEQGDDVVTLMKLVTTPNYKRALLITVMLMIMQQASGINAVMFYSTTIFEAAGLGRNAQYATIGLGVFNVLMTVVAIYIIERIGRKKLLLWGLVGMTFAMGSLMVCLFIVTGGKTHREDKSATVGSGLAVFSVLSIIVYIAFFAIGPGPIPWFIVNELFSAKARPPAASVGVAVNWFFNFVIAWIFPPIQTQVGPYAFLIFIASNALFTAYVAIFVPETKGRSASKNASGGADKLPTEAPTEVGKTEIAEDNPPTEGVPI